MQTFLVVGCGAGSDQVFDRPIVGPALGRRVQREEAPVGGHPQGAGPDAIGSG